MNVMDLKQVYGALLSSPGMNDQVKVDLKITRRMVMLFCQAIERGLAAKNEGNAGMIESVSDTELKELKELSSNCLEKAGLTEFYGKLSAIATK